jgi:glycosyltransferase involved in cell wall biosynthesis
VIIPVYNEENFIKNVISKIPKIVEQIIVVDDCSKDSTSDIVLSLADDRIKLIKHEINTGVGGAVISGYRYALKAGADIVVKIDGDGQMDPEQIPKIVSPIIDGKADYCKGFRFHDTRNLKGMPVARLIGNIGLSFLTKIASGYWNIFDPTSGYTAIHREALSLLKLDNLHNGYFFESDMLINLYKIQAVVMDVEISNKYGDEESQLNPVHVSFEFSYLLIKATIKRFLWRYFIADFTPVSLFTVIGLPMFIYGLSSGLYNWILNSLKNIPTPVGTIMITVIFMFFGFQLLLQAVVLDINNVPQNKIQSVHKWKEQ